jgi:hypothetical protein
MSAYELIRNVFLCFLGLIILQNPFLWFFGGTVLVGGYYVLRGLAKAFYRAATLFFFSLMMLAFVAAVIMVLPSFAPAFKAIREM